MLICYLALQTNSELCGTLLQGAPAPSRVRPSPVAEAALTHFGRSMHVRTVVRYGEIDGNGWWLLTNPQLGG